MAHTWYGQHIRRKTSIIIFMLKMLVLNRLCLGTIAMFFRQPLAAVSKYIFKYRAAKKKNMGIVPQWSVYDFYSVFTEKYCYDND